MILRLLLSGSPPTEHSAQVLTIADDTGNRPRRPARSSALFGDPRGSPFMGHMFLFIPQSKSPFLTTQLVFLALPPAPTPSEGKLRTGGGGGQRRRGNSYTRCFKTLPRGHLSLHLIKQVVRMHPDSVTRLHRETLSLNN